MTWLTPLIGAVAAAIAVPALLILYFLKLRRREVEISTTLLWKKAIEDIQANAPFQRLRRNLLLFLQLLVLAAVCLGLAQPSINGRFASGERHVIVIDRSASMQTLDAEGDGSDAVTRLEQAKADAWRLIEEKLGESQWMLGNSLTRASADEAMIVVFDAAGQVVQPFTSDKAALKAALDSITPYDTPTRIEEAVGLIQAYAPKREISEVQPDGTVRVYERPGGRVGTIHIFSDGRIPDFADAQFGPEDTLLYYPIGKETTRNVGITGLQAGRSFKDPSKLSIFVGLQSTYTVERRIDVSIVFEGNVVPPQTQEIVIPPAVVKEQASSAGAVTVIEPASSGCVFRLDYTSAAVATIRIAPALGAAGDPDPFAVDNEVSIVIPEAKRLNVAFVTDGNFFLSHALRALPLGSLTVLSTSEFQPEDAEKYDAVVLDRWIPDATDAGEALPPGRYLIFGAVPAGAGLTDEGVRQETLAQVIDWQRDHPILREINLDNLHILNPRIVAVDPGSSAAAIVHSTHGPAVVETAGLRYRAIVVPFDVLASNWGVDISWVVFLGSSLRYLGERDAGGVGGIVRPGEIFTSRLPADASGIVFRSPDRSTADVIPNVDGTITVGPIKNIGIHSIEWKGSPGPGDRVISGVAVRPVAANLLDGAESIVATNPTIASRNATLAGAEADDRQAPRNLWPWLLLLALAVLTFEWWVYNRKVYL